MTNDPTSPTVSVIVPCFDVERYLDECVESIVGQTYSQLEIIAVDDGSRDTSGAMLDRWHERDDRIVVIHQPNGGLGAARNAGVARATGHLLTFVDADDVLPIDAIERMVATIERTGSDFVTGVAERFDGDTSWRAALYRQGFERDLDRTHVYERPSLLHDHIVCSKLFRTSFWRGNGFSFPEGTLFEDIELAVRAHCLATAVDIVAEPTYRWRSRPPDDPSITQDRRRPGAVTARFEALARADAFIRDHAPPDIWRHHGLKILSVDVPLYLQHVDHADEAFVQEFVDAAGAMLASVSPQAITEQGPLRRRLISMLSDGDVANVRAMSRLLGPRTGRTILLRLSGARMLDRRQRWWLLGLGLRLPWYRVRRRLGRHG